MTWPWPEFARATCDWCAAEFDLDLREAFLDSNPRVSWTVEQILAQGHYCSLHCGDTAAAAPLPPRRGTAASITNARRALRCLRGGRAS